MKILSVCAEKRRRTFTVKVRGRQYAFPFARCVPKPSASDPVVEAFVDRELGREAFTYRLRGGREGTVHVEQVLDYHKDPSYLRDMLLYRLTLAARQRLAAAPLPKREIIRRLATSPAQLYRLLDPANYAKSVDQMLRLLTVLDCEVEMRVRPRVA